MALLNDLGRKISEAGQSTVQRTKDFSEISKINTLISKEEKKIEELYSEIGKLFVKLHSKDYEVEFRPEMDELIAARRSIEGYERQIRTIKGLTKCKSCGEEILLFSKYCPKCGINLDKNDEVEDMDHWDEDWFSNS